MSSRSSDPNRPPSRPRALVLAILLIPIGGALLLFHALPRGGFHSPANGGYVVVGTLNDSAKGPEPQFSQTPTPLGKPSLQDLRFRPLVFPDGAGSGVTLVYRPGIVRLQDRRTGAMMWMGPVTAESFSLRSVGGVHTLTDDAGKALWTDAVTARPDLRLDRAADGQAVLTGKDGATLWSGRLPPPTPGRAVTAAGGPGTASVVDGLHVAGVRGIFRVTDDTGRLLWTGRLPANPTIVAHADSGFTAVGPRGVESGPNGVHLLGIGIAPGSVNIADARGKFLTNLPIPLCAVRESPPRSDGARPGPPPPQQDITPDGVLDATGTLLLTYQASMGHVVRRSKVYRAADGRGGCLG